MSRLGTIYPNLSSVVAPPGVTDDILGMHLSVVGSDSGPAPASGATEVSPSSVPLPTSLSPEALMAYCQARLQSLDNQMNGIFASQTSNATMTQDVNNVANRLNDLPPAAGNPPLITVDSSDKDTIMQAYSDAIADAHGTPLAAALTQDQKAFKSAVEGGNGSMTPDELTLLTTNLKNDASNLNSDSEMTMITLQSLMSQRQTAVQLTTNLVQSLGDQQNSIAKNIGQ